MSDPLLGTPRPRRVVESNARFILVGAGLLILLIIGGVVFAVYSFGKRNEDNRHAVLEAKKGGSSGENAAPLLDLKGLHRKGGSEPVPATRLVPAIPPPSADITRVANPTGLNPTPVAGPAPPPPVPAPPPAAVRPPAAAPAVLPKQPWHKPEMSSGGSSARGGGGGGPPPGQSGNVQPAGYNTGGDGGGSRDSREAFNTNYGRNKPLYLGGRELPPLTGCVGRVGSLIPVVTTGVVKTAVPGDFEMQVLQSLEGRRYDGDTVEPCDNPLVPSGTTVTCSANTVDVQRGDKVVQVVCNRLNFPLGGTLPITGFPLVSADGSTGVGAEASYNWGEMAGAIALDIVSVIPSAIIAGISRNGSNGSSNNIILNAPAQAAGQSTRSAVDEVTRNAFTRKPILIIPAGAKARLRFPVDVALPNQRR